MGHIGSGVVLNGAAFVHETAYLYGHIHLGPDSSVWPHVTMRAEIFDIRIGSRSNVQDFVMIHVGYATPTIVGEDCSITHHATLHGCEIGDRCLIGINATVMDGARIGENSIVAGHSIVTEGAEFEPNAIIAGVPAKQVGTRDNAVANIKNAQFYVENAHNYANGIERFTDAQIARVLGGTDKV